MNKFEPYQRVLARDSYNSKWRSELFSYYEKEDGDDSPYHCVGHISYRFLIPYEGNEHLEGTTNLPYIPDDLDFGDKVMIQTEEDIFDNTWRKGLFVKWNPDSSSVFIVIDEKGHYQAVQVCRKGWD